MIDSIEQEIWNDFKKLSEHDFLDKMKYADASPHFGRLYEDRISSTFLNQKIVYDIDKKIDSFLANNENIDWYELEKLYPIHHKIQLPTTSATNYPTPKFRTHKERRDIDIILLNEWEDKKVRLYTKIPNETIAKEYLIDIRWDDKPICPHCGGTKIYILSSHSPFKCAKCGVKFSEKVGTIFENSKLNLLKWYEAMYLLTSIKTRKISTHQLADTLSITQTTSWGMVNKIQSKVNEDFVSKIRKGLFK